MNKPSILTNRWLVINSYFSSVLAITKDKNKIVNSFQFTKSLPIEISKFKVNHILFPNERNTRFSAIYGNREDLLKIYDELKKD